MFEAKITEMDIKKYKIDIPVVLPEALTKRDECIHNLTSILGSKNGISEVHIDESQGSHPAKVCVHFDPKLWSPSKIENLVTTIGAQVRSRFGHSTLLVHGVRHQRHALEIADGLLKIEGILNAHVSGTGVVAVEHDKQIIGEQDVVRSVESFGLQIDKKNAPEPASKELVEKHEDYKEQKHTHGHFWGDRTELYFAITSAIFLSSGFVLENLIQSSGWGAKALYVAAYFFGGFFAAKDAFENLKKKRFEIDTLMIVAAIGAATLGKWAEGALLLTLFSLGHALEHFAMGRAKKAIEALADLAPKKAHLLKDNQQLDVPIEQLNIGDVVVVKPNERIPVDGFVTKGSSSVNEAPVTGESIPVDKIPFSGLKDRDVKERIPKESLVFTGTINGQGLLEIQVTRLSTESTLARVVQLVTEAQAQISPTQRLTDKFEKIFVPTILMFVSCLLLVFLVKDESFSDSFYRAMSVLVAASPCALAISTPSAVLSGIARAGRAGVLIKGGAALENFGKVSTIAFDKTGTITLGKPVLTDVICEEGITEKVLLEIAGSVENQSDHPIARAIADGAFNKLGQFKLKRPTSIQSLTGRGIKSVIDGEEVFIGKKILFSELGGGPIPASIEESVRKLEGSGRTTMVVKKGQQYLGTLGVMDKPRSKARESIERLRKTGVKRMLMLSGDNQIVANAVAQEVGLNEAFGDLLPQDKVSKMREIKSTGNVAMVGDGVNDAPAMASATVSVAMGAVGSDVALEAADIALMTDDLSRLAFARGLSHKATCIIKQNLWVSLGVVALLVPATLFGLGIGPAVIMHEGSTVVVVLNALRLLSYRDHV